MQKIWLALVAVVGTACYTYSPTPVSELRPGTRVTADLTARGSVAHEAQLGGEAQQIEGTVGRPLPNDSLQVLLTRIRNRQGGWITWTGEPVAFSSDAFSTVRGRKLSVTRTAAATAILAGLFGVMITSDIFGTGGDRPAGKVEPPVL